MKKILLPLFVLVIAGCGSNSKPKENSPEIPHPDWTETNDKALKDIIEFETELYSEATRSGMLNVPEGLNTIMRFSQETDKFSSYNLPAYVLDEDKFMKDPSAENLFDCVIPSDKLMFIYAIDAEDSFLLEATEHDGKWGPVAYMHDWDKTVEWLQKEFDLYKSTNFRLLKFYGHIYIILFRYEKPVFYDFSGRIQSKEELAAGFKNKIEVMKSPLKGFYF